jgi:hypothetical protein
MANRILNSEELVRANKLLDEIRVHLKELPGEDPELLFAYRRKNCKATYLDERSGPMARRKLKVQKRKEQGGLCAECREPLPENYTVLDRFRAVEGYIPENTRLICEQCDRKVQKQRGYA